MRLNALRRLLAAAAIFTLVGPAAAYSNLYVFGDSLSDTGKMSPNPSVVRVTKLK